MAGLPGGAERGAGPVTANRPDNVPPSAQMTSRECLTRGAAAPQGPSEHNEMPRRNKAVQPRRPKPPLPSVPDDRSHRTRPWTA